MDQQLPLFKSTTKPENIPLAESIRPANLEEVIGQSKIIGPNSQLREMIQNDNYDSFILWGPPGTGKTTIAKIIENSTKNPFLSFSAVLSSIKDVKSVMKEADYVLKLNNVATILFVDEIHRFNKSQQDAFLPYVESGAIILIGATTENPSFEVIPALLSRCQVFVLEHLKKEDIKKIIVRALKKTGNDKLLEENGVSYIADLSSGDGRKALNYLQTLIRHFKGDAISVEELSKLLQKKSMFYDKNKEEHYNVISALHKSLRGSDAQAGLYWLARLLEAGEDPKFVIRRLIRFASEDIGLADPNALVQAIACKEAIHFLGMPEANTALAQLIVYLATAPKSNSVYTAYKLAKDDAIATSHHGVPMHIRNAPTKLMKDLDYGKNYRYDHEYENSYSYQNYFPETMEEKTYYTPHKFGFEKEIKKRLDWWRKLKTQETTKK